MTYSEKILTKNPKKFHKKIQLTKDDFFYLIIFFDLTLENYIFELNQVTLNFLYITIYLLFS